jgi:hypothetical protein
MKKYLVFIPFLFLCFEAQSSTVPSYSSATPSLTNPLYALQHFATLSIKEVQKLAGRKLTLKEKITIRIFQWKIKRSFTDKGAGEYKDKGKTAFTFGLIALISFLLTPLVFFGFLAAIPFAIAAIVTGKKALQGNPDDRKAKTGMTLGWITIGLLIILAAAIGIFLTTWTFGWG